MFIFNYLLFSERLFVSLEQISDFENSCPFNLFDISKIYHPWSSKCPWYDTHPYLGPIAHSLSWLFQSVVGQHRSQQHNNQQQPKRRQKQTHDLTPDLKNGRDSQIQSFNSLATSAVSVTALNDDVLSLWLWLIFLWAHDA